VQEKVLELVTNVTKRKTKLKQDIGRVTLPDIERN